MNSTEKSLNYNFKDKELLKRALTLSSYSAEFNNQTLEFLGDAVLEFVVSEKIYDENLTEGQLTDRRKALVSDSALTPVSVKLGLDKALIKNAHDTNNKKAIPSVYEAVIAAIYLDGGMDAAKKFILDTLDFSVREEPDFKSELQVYMQGFGECPTYDTKDKGTPQSPEFEAKVVIFGNTFCGSATSKRQAEKNAARRALEKLKKDGKL